MFQSCSYILLQANKWTPSFDFPSIDLILKINSIIICVNLDSGITTSVGFSDNPIIDPVHDQQSSSTWCVNIDFVPSLDPGIDPNPVLLLSPITVLSHGPNGSSIPFLGLDLLDCGVYTIPGSIPSIISSLNISVFVPVWDCHKYIFSDHPSPKRLSICFSSISSYTCSCCWQ